MTIEQGKVEQWSASQRLVAVDFDDTTNLTSERSPELLTVDQASVLALTTILDATTAANYSESGGHGGRTPAKIIADLHPDMTEDEVQAYTAQFVTEKMALLSQQIGTVLPDGALWPRVTDGFADCWNKLGENNPGCVTTAVLSAGHEPFIHASFDLHGLNRPDILVTDDLLIDLMCLAGQPIPGPKERGKPSPYIMDAAIGLWLERFGVDPTTTSIHRSEQILFVGDSVEKDGGLAQNTGAAFMHLEHEMARETWQAVSVWAGATALQGAQRV